MRDKNTKIITAVAVCALALALLVGISKYKKSPVLYSSSDSPKSDELTTAPSKDLPPPDSDKDGLFDWEEILWKTDANDPDTDNDGISDGEEVKNNQNPLGVKSAASQTGSKTADPLASLSETDIFSRQIFAKYLQEKNVGLTSTPEEYQKILETIFNKERTSFPPKQYSTADLKIIEGTAAVNVFRTYGADFGAAMTKKPGEENIEYELLVLQRAVTEKDPQILDSLTNNIAAYSRVLTDLEKIPVPQALVPEHLIVMDSLSIMRRSTEGMQLFFSDPVKTAAFMEGYPQATEDFFEALSNIKTYLEIKGVSFKQGDDGFEFWSRI